jgi:hypothetical protein
MPLSNYQVHNVNDYTGATTTLKFKKAVDDALADGYPVYVPTGEYVIDGRFATVNEQTIVESGTAQNGGSSTTIKLQASSSLSVYVGRRVRITAGMCNGQERRITAWDAANKIATIDPAWTSCTPNNTTNYEILQGDKPLKMFGDGPGLSILKISGDITTESDTPIFIRGTAIYTHDAGYDQKSLCEFDGLEFDGEGFNLQYGWIRASFAAHAYFSRCWWRQCNSPAITGFQWWDSVFTECSWVNCGDPNDIDRPAINFENAIGGNTANQGTPQAVGANTITLNTSASDLPQFYKDFPISITAGPGSPQDNKITSYSALRVATVEDPWTIPQPTTASTYQVKYVANLQTRVAELTDALRKQGIIN